MDYLTIASVFWLVIMIVTCLYAGSIKEKVTYGLILSLMLLVILASFFKVSSVREASYKEEYFKVHSTELVTKCGRYCTSIQKLTIESLDSKYAGRLITVDVPETFDAAPYLDGKPYPSIQYEHKLDSADLVLRSIAKTLSWTTIFAACFFVGFSLFLIKK